MVNIEATLHHADITRESLLFKIEVKSTVSEIMTALRNAGALFGETGCTLKWSGLTSARVVNKKGRTVVDLKVVSVTW